MTKSVSLTYATVKGEVKILLHSSVRIKVFNLTPSGI